MDTTVRLDVERVVRSAPTADSRLVEALAPVVDRAVIQGKRATQARILRALEAAGHSSAAELIRLDEF